MISLSQVELLEQKVESAVEKIQQLQAENDALRKKCSELTNAISAKSEQLTSFESEQVQIENGIKKALERLNSIENSVLKAVSQVHSPTENQNIIKTQSEQIPSFEKLEPVPVESENSIQQEISIPKQNFTNSINNFQNNEQQISQNQEINDDNDFQETEDFADDENQDGLGFDIF